MKVRTGHNIRSKDQGHFSQKWTVLMNIFDHFNCWNPCKTVIIQSGRTSTEPMPTLIMLSSLYDDTWIKNNPNLTQFIQYMQTEPYGRRRVANFQKDIIRNHENVTDRQMERNFSRRISVRNEPRFPLEKPWKSLEDVILFSSPDTVLRSKSK